MNTAAILSKMHEQGVVAVLAPESVEEAVQIADACAQGGIEIFEVTFSVPGADRAIAALAEKGYTVGAGTILNVDQSLAAVSAGAQFIVAPTVNSNVSMHCANSQVPYIPGCMTINEMHFASKIGCKFVKLFPCGEFTPNYIKAIHAPFPGLHIIPAGGVNLGNVKDWIQAGASCVEVGGSLTKIGDGGCEAITQLAKDFHAAILEVRA